MRYKNNALILLIIFLLLLLFSSCSTNNNSKNMETPSNKKNETLITEIPNYGIISGFSNKNELVQDYNGDFISFNYNIYNPEAPIEWGYEVFINGVLQTFSVYSDNVLIAENTNMFTKHFDKEENLDCRIVLKPNIGNKGDTLELNVCSILNPSYMLEDTTYVSFLPYHRMSASTTATIHMNTSVDNKVNISSFEGTYKKVSEETRNEYTSLNSNGEEINTFDNEFVFDVFKDTEQDDIIETNSVDTIKVFGCGKPGKYRISIFVNNEISKAFNNHYYCDVEVLKDQEFIIEIPVELKNEMNHIYVVAFEKNSNDEITNNYIKSNTKLLIKE